MAMPLIAFLFDLIDDLLYLAGCILILYGVYQVNPVLVWFVAGVMCIIAGIVLAIARRRP